MYIWHLNNNNDIMKKSIKKNPVLTVIVNSTENLMSTNEYMFKGKYLLVFNFL